MALTNTSTKVTYTGNGVTRAWSFTFPSLSASHILLYITDENGKDTLVTGNYKIDMQNSIVTYPVSGSPISEDYRLTIMRRLPIVQTTDLDTQDTLDAETLETAYDYLTMVAQQLDEQLGRTLTGSVTTDGEEFSETVNQFLEDAEMIKTLADRAESYMLDGCEIGQPAIFKNDCEPDGYLPMDGSEYDTDTYSELYEILWSAYTPDWSASHQLPSGYSWYIKAKFRVNPITSAKGLSVACDRVSSDQEPYVTFEESTSTVMFHIPDGEKGPTGDKGETGDKGPQGDKGETGDAPVGLSVCGFTLDPSTGHLWFAMAEQSTGYQADAAIRSDGHCILTITGGDS